MGRVSCIRRFGFFSEAGLMVSAARKHVKIVGALIMREIITKYGREGIGFLWVIGEPLMFCFGVLIMWSLIKPAYEHGVRIAPFVMTGYMCLLMLRHIISYNIGAVPSNIGLLYHRKISIIHIYMSRNILELAGSTGAFIVVYIILYSMGFVDLPHDVLILYSGWMLLFWLSSGIGIVFSALALMYDVMERVVSLLQYVLVPMTGTFFMISWLPPAAQEAVLWIPIPHTVEMVRAGVFGEFVATHYDPLYPLIWGTALNLLGLLLLRHAQRNLEIE